MRNLDKFSRLYSGRVATLEDGDVFRACVPVARTAAGAGQDAVLELATSIIERDGSLTTSELAKAGDVSVRTGQRWVRSLLESGRLKASAAQRAAPGIEERLDFLPAVRLCQTSRDSSP